MSLFALLAAAAVVNWAEASPVPGQCAAPAAENVGKPGCYGVGEIQIEAAPAELWWRIYEFDTLAAAQAAGAGVRWSLAAASHGRSWLHVIGGPEAAPAGGVRRAVIGPLAAPAGQTVSARFMESVFTPGMRTRVHSHAGPEAFYVVEGEQCMETPADRRKLKAGETYVVAPGPHLQAAAKGRKNLVLVLTPKGAPLMAMEAGWTPSQFCAS